jgi:hypothetical protein
VGRLEAPGLGWHSLAQLIVERNRHGHQIATVWHPEPVGEMLETRLGNVRVCKGDPAYQLTTGDVIEI